MKDPLSYAYSIASGHNYRRIDSLLELNLVIKNVISLVRSFGQTIHLNSRTHSSHAITFDSNGPQISISSMLETLNNNCLP